MAKVDIFSWNQYNKGKSWSYINQFTASTSGIMTKNILFNAGSTEWGRIIDTDYTTYAVVYRCVINLSAEKLLDGY